jgi:proline iminopeptidase
MTSVRSRFVDVPGARLAVYDGGVADRPILLLHGGPGVPDYLRPVANFLANDHRVIRFDQRGTGASPCHDRRYGLDQHVEDVEAVRQACGVARVGLFGHSWGGLLAQLYTSRYPDRVSQLCLCNSSIGVGEDWRVMERVVLAFNRRRGGWSGFLRLGLDQALALLPGGLGDRAARRMMARVWRHYFDPPSAAPRPSPTWLAGIHSRPVFATRQAIVAADAGRLHPVPPTLPVLIIFGEQDIYGETTTRLIRRVPHARAVTLAGAGHIPWLQSQTAFATEVRSFFNAAYSQATARTAVGQAR